MRKELFMSVYDDNFLDDEQKKKIAAFTEEWNKAYAAGDRAGMDAAHAAAERVRAQAGYSGGENGGSYIELGGGSSGSSAGLGYGGASTLKSYEAQVDAVNDVYDRALEAHLAGLRSAYEESAAAAKAAKEAIPGIYQDEKNDLAAQSAIAEKNFEEIAAGTGLASGARGQVRLAMENTRQAGMSELGKQEGADLAEAERFEAELMRTYQNGIVEAVASGEYERAAALLEEYRRAGQSNVTVSKDQADEFYRWRQQRAKEIDEASERLRKEAEASGR